MFILQGVGKKEGDEQGVSTDLQYKVIGDDYNKVIGGKKENNSVSIGEDKSMSFANNYVCVAFELIKIINNRNNDCGARRSNSQCNK